MTLSPDQTALLVDRIVESVQPLRIVLFGSCARGGAGPTSDIDLLIVVPDGSHRLHTAQTVYRALLGSRLPVDVVVATPSDLTHYGDAPGTVYRQALRDGLELYAA